jgi:DNA processing protein
VLGCGVDVVYPPEHRDLMRRICDTGSVISEFPPGAPPRPNHFPLRNRIISGLSHAVVVIEASEKSGSLITAKAALEQGRDVLAVPGAISTGRNRGGHALIKDGARLVETVEDVLDEMGWRPRPGSERPRDGDKEPAVSKLEAAMDPGETYSLDELAAATGHGAAELLAELADLELAGRVARVGGGNFAKLDRPA